MRRLLLTAVALALVAPPAAAADLEQILGSRWHGAWVVITAAVGSDCDDRYTNNRVEGQRVSSGAAVRLEAGELAQVHRVDVKRSRIEVLLDLDEGFLLSSRDGPFTLYDDAHCRVELLIEVPRQVVKRNDLAAAEALLGRLLERHDRREEAQGSEAWNRRRREPFPTDYEATLAEYQVWKAQQVNGAVQARLDRAVDDAAAVARSLRPDAAYLDGFATGAEAVRSAYFGACDWLLSASFYAFRHSPPGGHERRWKEGYDDGQLLVFNLELARRLRECFVPPPPGG